MADCASPREDSHLANPAYDSLGQVTNAVRRWSDNSLVAGQQYGFQFDTIGNRLQSAVCGLQSSYTANLLNQYTQRTVPGLVEAFGGAATNATVTVNDAATTRHGEYWYKAMSVNNGPSAVYTQLHTVGVVIAGSNIVT